MAEMLPSWPLLAAFLSASFVLAVTPGPGVIYIVTRSLAQGRRAGLASVGGVALGNLGNAIGASLGLAALFAASSAAFMVVKYAGAAYLLYLGVQAFRQRSTIEHAGTGLSHQNACDPWHRSTAVSTGRIFRDGFVVAVLNPKTAIFFAAFLPQFMTASGSHALQSVLLGGLFVLMAAATDTLYATTAGLLAPALARARGVRRAGHYASGGAFIGLGLYTALSGARGPR